jgi:23S rRNA pseudouridine1911/1915/1917 synthase
MPEQANAAFSYIVDDDEEGVRLDTLINSVFPDLSRTLAGRLIREGRIEVNGRIRKPSYRAASGEIVSGTIPPLIAPPPAPEALPVDILYEDHDLIVLNKPPGLVVHPAPGHSGGTLCNALLYRYPEIRGVGGIESRSGIVHRLDKDTSGVMAAARTGRAYQALTRQFKTRSIRKTYQGFVYGRPATEGAVSLPVGRHPGLRKKMTTLDPANPRDAETRWEVTAQWDDIALVAFFIATGRTHQIRVHCAAIHHPIIGDTLYGPRRPDRCFSMTPKTAAVLPSVSRHLLHARRLCLAHPVSGQTLTFEAPVPRDMRDFQAALVGGNDD